MYSNVSSEFHEKLFIKSLKTEEASASSASMLATPLIPQTANAHAVHLWQLLMRQKSSLTVGLWMFMVIIPSLLFIDFARDYRVFLAFPLFVIGGAGVAMGYLFPW